MNLLELLIFFAMVCVLGWSGYTIGHRDGRRLGYNQCIAEEDGDAPRDFSTYEQRHAEDAKQ